MEKFNVVSLIRKKRDRQSLDDEEIGYIIHEYTHDRIPDYQMSALLMALFLNGISPAESASLTRAMLYSGKIIDLSDIPGKKIDKHSTGGVGDKVSLILAPIVASCGVPVPMIAGRGLGHTGGTLDRLESITGFRTDLNLDRFREILKATGMVIAGQTDEVAPADKRIYALRDVTATVECIPLIASSIMSKKLAEGIDALVLDVKCGDGAFMRSEDDAIVLAQTLVDIGEEFGKQTIAYITDMNQPLGYNIGNWLEVEECISCLHGNGPADLMEITRLLAATMIWLGGKAGDIDEGIEMADEAISSGRAWDKFYENVRMQGGDVNLLDHPENYKETDYSFTITASRDGYLTKVGAFKLGQASIELGAGRKSKNDHIDPAAGLILNKKVGDYVKKGETIVTSYTNNKASKEQVSGLIGEALEIEDKPCSRSPLIRFKISKDGVISI